MVSPIEINFMKLFTVTDLWHLGRKFQKDFGNPEFVHTSDHKIQAQWSVDDRKSPLGGMGAARWAWVIPQLPHTCSHPHTDHAQGCGSTWGTRNVTSQGPSFVESWDYVY